jgi:carbon monoxide dehydrogenase subunit G
MTKIESSTIINSPVKAVWGFVSDLSKLTEWHPGVLEVKWEKPLGHGSIFELTVQRLGRRRTICTITEYEINRSIGWETRLMSNRLKVTYTMGQVEGNKTRLKDTFDLEIGGLMKLIQPFIVRRARKLRKAQILILKHMLEG